MGLGRRRFLGLSAAAFGASGLTGCERGQAAGEAIRLQGWEFETALVEQNLERFRRNYPYAGVEFDAIPASDYRRTMDAQLASKSASHVPDVLYVNDDALAGWASRGYLRPIDDLPDIGVTYEALYAGNAAAMSYDNKRFGLPFHTDVVCLIYRPELLERAGFSEPPQSLEGLLRQALRIRERRICEYPIAISAKETGRPVREWWPWWWALVFASGGQLFDNRMAPIMVQAEDIAYDVLAWLRDAVGQGIVDRRAVEVDRRRAERDFAAGRHAFLLGMRRDVRRFKDAMIGLVPGLTSSVGTVSTTSMYCVAAKGDRPSVSGSLLRFLGGLDSGGDPESARFWFKQRALGFAYQDLANDSEIRGDVARFADPEVYFALSDMARPRRTIATPWHARFEAVSQRAIRGVITGQRTPDQAVKLMESAAGRPS